jgi:hypothetical protein
MVRWVERKDHLYVLCSVTDTSKSRFVLNEFVRE